MNLFKKISSLVIILICTSMCTEKPSPTQAQLELLQVTSELFLDDKEVLFHKTLDKKLAKEVLGVPLSNDLLERNLLATEADMDSLFDEHTFRKLNRAFKNYQTLNLDSLNSDLGKLVTEEEIPDYVRDQRPTPNWEVEFTSVLYLSTPIVYKNRAIVLINTSGDMPIGIEFFIKEEGKWRMVGSTF